MRMHAAPGETSRREGIERRRRRGRRRRGAGHRPPEQDEPGGRDDGRPVREGRRRPRDPDPAGRREPGADGPRRAALAEDVGLRFQAAAQGRRRRAGDRPLGAGRAGVGAHEPGRVDHRRDAGRELEDEPDGGALLGRCRRRARGSWSSSRGGSRTRGRGRRTGGPSGNSSGGPRREVSGCATSPRSTWPPTSGRTPGRSRP